jgi:hypothetical protein
MAELTINLPDALAEDVRRLDIAVDAVCQRALLDSVAARAPRPAAAVGATAPVPTYRSRAVVELARGHGPAPTSVDLLQGLASEGDVAREVLRVLGVDIDVLAASAAVVGPQGVTDADPLDVVVGRAVDVARNLAVTYVGSEHLLLALATAAPTEVVARALRSHGVDPATLRLATVSMLAGFELARSSGGLASRSAG